MEDKEILEAAKKALETALNEFVQNYTEAEAQAIKEDLDRIDQALKSIQNVQTVTDAIKSFPIQTMYVRMIRRLKKWLRRLKSFLKP